MSPRWQWNPLKSCCNFQQGVGPAPNETLNGVDVRRVNGNSEDFDDDIIFLVGLGISELFQWHDLRGDTVLAVDEARSHSPGQRCHQTAGHDINRSRSVTQQDLFCLHTTGWCRKFVSRCSNLDAWKHKWFSITFIILPYTDHTMRCNKNTECNCNALHVLSLVILDIVSCFQFIIFKMNK